MTHRCTLFTAVRNEAPFLVEWIAYHKVIGFDNIIVVSNDCTDGTTELLDALDTAGEIIHVSQTVAANQRAQGQAAQIVNQRGLLNTSDWAMWLDADEFLNIHVGSGHVDDLIAEIGDCHGILLHWRLFGDGGNKRFGGRFISPEYVDAAPDSEYQHFNLKTMFRVSPGNTWLNLAIHRPTLKSGVYTLSDFLTGDGLTLEEVSKSQDRQTDPMEFWYINQNWIEGNTVHKVRGITKHGSFGHSLAQVNHYAVRTPEHYALKVRRGNGFTEGGHMVENNRHGEKYYLKYNGSGIADETILRHEQRVTKEMGRLRAIQAVSDAEASSAALVHEQIRAVPAEEISRYEAISAGPAPASAGASNTDAKAAQAEGPLTFANISRELKDFVHAEGLSANLKAAWVYKKTCFVMNFIENGIMIGFDFTPTAEGTLRVELVHRPSEAASTIGFRMIPNGKETLSSSASIAEAKIILREKVTLFKQLISSPNATLVKAEQTKRAEQAGSALKLFWWNGKENFGDALSQLIVEHVSGRDVEWAPAHQADIFAIGSIMQFVQQGHDTPKDNVPYIWGTGMMGPHSTDFTKNVTFCSVRGPATAALLGGDIKSFGDPGLLSAELLSDRPEQRDIVGLIPHHNKTHFFSDHDYGSKIQVIDVRTNDAISVIKQIAQCRHIYSESLHGLIIADAFGIPNTWVRGKIGIHSNPEFKFIDYFLSVERPYVAPVLYDDLLNLKLEIDDNALPYQGAIDRCKAHIRAAFPQELVAKSQ